MNQTMKGMSIGAMAEVCNGIYHGPLELKSKCITAITTDSRKIEEGCMFIAIKGLRSDGHDYIDDCFDRGAIVCISEKELEGQQRPYIQVEASLEAIKKLAAYYRKQLDVKVIGITGSVGKTTTKETVATVLSTKYKVLKTLGNFNNELGLPLTIFRLREDDEIAVLEMGISDFGEMRRLANIARPDMCIITNIGLCHLENLKNRDGILKAKTEIFEGMGETGVAILNGDDDKLITVSDVNGSKPVYFGIENKSGVYVTDVESLGLEGTRAVICGLDLNGSNTTAAESEGIQVTIPVPGVHMVYNSMAAAAVGALCGLSASEIAKGISELKTISGRSNIIKTDKYLIIDDCYNANPVSMKAAIDTLDMAKGRKVAILGDMFELGENEKQLHYEVGTHIGTSSTDVLITVGELAKNIAEGAVSAYNINNSLELHSFNTKEELFDKINGLIRNNDNILVKASHGMEFYRIIETIEAM